MKTKHLTGDSAYNDALNLPAGMLSIDTERKALRFHDGQTVGGYEMVGRPAVTGPGPTELIAGDMSAGFFGEVTSTELFTYEALATQIGLSAGVSQYNAESLWLKFALDGKVLFVAKKPARYDVSWSHINTVNAVFEGGSQVTVGSTRLEVTLLRGANSNPVVGIAGEGYDLSATHGSEWNRLLYPVHSGTHTYASNPSVHTDSSADPFGSWATYSDSDLVVNVSDGNGSRTWCQETPPASSTNRIFRGKEGITLISWTAATYDLAATGWRPCLRLV